ncbi:MAG: hypothetical protein Alpg2KO_29250 [Alphaproteobacteria bacterium]
MTRLIPARIKGASGISYGLVLGLIGVVAISTIDGVGDSINSLFGETNDSLTTVIETSGIAGSGGSASPAPSASATPLPVYSSCAETLSANPSLAGMDGDYQIDITGSGPEISVYCDMTTDGGGWTMYYTTNSTFSLIDATTNSTSFGTNGYSRDLRDLAFTDILYVRHSDNAKDWFTNSVSLTVEGMDTPSVGVCTTSSTPAGPYICGTGLGGTWTGGGGANTGYTYQLTVGDNVWMQVGLMISGYNAGGTSNCFKQPNNWCGDTSSNYYRVYGEGNGVMDIGGFGGVAFRENGHTNVTSKLMSVGIR